MKLCFIADGRTIHTQRWVEYFAKNHEVSLVTYDPMGRDIEGVSEFVLPPVMDNLYLSFWPRHLKLMKILKEIAPDVIHAHFIAKYGFHLPFIKKQPKVLSAWGDDILILPQKSRVLRFFTGQSLKSADLIYAVSRDIEKRIRDEYRIPDTKIQYCPFGIDSKIFAPGPGTRKTTIPLTVFSNRGFFPVYDMTTLITGFVKAYKKNSGLRLILKGEGPEKETLKKQVETLGLGNVILFKEKTDYSQVAEDLRNSDIFLTTSVSDGTPVSLLEAMATELPCIATDVGGISEWIHDRENGILIPARSPEALATMILFLANDPDLRQKLGKNARKTISERGEWNNLMAGVEKDYERLVDRVKRMQS